MFGRFDLRRVSLYGALAGLLAVLPGLGWSEPDDVAPPKDRPKAEGKDNAKKPADDKAAPASPKAKAKASAPAYEWLGLEAGLEQVRRKYLPALVLFDAHAGDAARGGRPEADAAAGGGAAKAEPQAFFEDVLADYGAKETLKRFVLIRLTPEDLHRPYPAASKDEPLDAGPKAKKAGAKAAKGAGEEDPGDKDAAGAHGAAPAEGEPVPTVATRLGLAGELSAVVALSYWEEAVLTYKEGSLPTKTRIKSELSRIWKVNQIYATSARRIEPLLEKSRYAAKVGNQREAVLQVRDLEDAKVQKTLDPVLQRKVNKLIIDYRTKAQKSISEGNDLDAQKKYEQAIKRFDEIIVSFPFQDIIQQANKRKSECLRKLTIGF